MKTIDLNQLRDRAYKTACEHGFHDEELSNEHLLCLVISELMEAVEADRNGRLGRKCKSCFEIEYNRYPALVEESKRFECAFEKCVKDTVPDELADAVIRLLDLYGLRKIDLDEEAFDNETVQSYAKTYQDKSFTESVYYIVGQLSSGRYSIKQSVVLPEMLLLDIFGFAKHLGIDLFWHIEQKMRYNETRPIKHGKKY
ncbi:hypothetical protein [Phocaeicola sp.]